VILNFKDAETEKVYATGKSRKLGPIARVAARRLAAIEFAKALADLTEMPLKGDRKGQYSICIKGQYWLCFQWNGKDAADVEIVDYR